MTTILDPTDEREPIARQLSPRSGAISGTVAFLDISKPRGNVLLDQLEEQLKARVPDIEIVRYAKPTFTKPAPEPLRQEIRSKSDFVVEALAD
jgi:hypothetical protein